MAGPVVLIRLQRLSTEPVPTDSVIVVQQPDGNEFYPIAIRRLIHKLDRRLLPFIFLLGVSCFLNRVSIGHAKFMGIQADLRMSEAVHGLVIAIFYVAHFLFDIPSNLLSRWVGPTCYLASSMIAWGIITGIMTFVASAWQLLTLRFFLGVVQAGYFSGIIIYFSLWYRKKDQTMRIALLLGAAITSRALGGVLAIAMEKLEGAGDLHSWQWMFLLESLPIIPLGIITCLFLDNVPNAVQWLNSSEKQLLTNLLRNDLHDADLHPEVDSRLSWRQVRYVFTDWRIYFYALIAVGNDAVILCLTAFLPTIMHTMNYSSTETHLMPVPLYIIACACCLLVSYSSSRRHEFGCHIAFSLAVALIGFILLLTLFQHGKVVNCISTGITLCGVLSAFPLLLSWLTNNVAGHTKRGMAISFVISCAQIGGIISPLIYSDADAPTYRRGHSICAGIVAISLLLTILLRIFLRRENHRRKNLSREQYVFEAAVTEPCDRHPDVRYVL